MSLLLYDIINAAYQNCYLFIKTNLPHLPTFILDTLLLWTTILDKALEADSDCYIYIYVCVCGTCIILITCHSLMDEDLQTKHNL